MGERKHRAVRERLARFGLRVVCLDCTTRFRWWPSEHGEPATPSIPVAGSLMEPATGVLFAHRARRLRDTRCPRCGAHALRSAYWTQRHPELAHAAREKALRERHALA